MIMADVYVPSVDKTWDFMLDENAQISIVVSEIAEQVSERLGLDPPDSSAGFSLYSADTEFCLPDAGTLAACGIKSGSRLLLV